MRLSSWSHPAPRISSTAASPVRLHCFASGGIQHIQVHPAPGRRCRRANGAWLVEYVHRAYRPGVGSVLHRNHHLAPRPSMTLTRPDSTCCAHVQIKVLVMSQAQRSQPVPRTHRNRRALQHGKAITGRSAPLSPPWCTAIGLLHGPVTSEAAVAAEGLHVTSQAYWSLFIQ